MLKLPLFLDVLKEPVQDIPLKSLSTAILNRIKEFCEKFADDQPYFPPAAYVADPAPWLDALGEFEDGELEVLANAANFLNIRRLIDATCMKIASLMGNNRLEDIQIICNLPRDLTEDEARERTETHVWALVEDPEDEIE